MKALSVRQPYAWAILHGGKDVENRSWDTSYRGPLLIHAGAKPHVHLKTRPWTAEAVNAACHDCGGFVGVVDLVAVFPPGQPIADNRWAESGMFKWVLANPRSILFVPARGRQGLFDGPDLC